MSNNRVQAFRKLSRRLSRTSLPPAKSARINTKKICQLLLGYAAKATIVDYLFPNGFCIIEIGRGVAEKIYDLRYIMKRWRCSVVFPIIDGGFIDRQPLSYVLLKQLQIKPPLSQVITQSV